VFELDLCVSEQTDDKWDVGLYLRCDGKAFETSRMLGGLRADFDLGAGGRDEHHGMDQDILHKGYGFDDIEVKKSETTLKCWVKINALRAEYGLTEEEEEEELVGGGVEETKDEGPETSEGGAP
jgi:hypothetical protein